MKTGYFRHSNNDFYLIPKDKIKEFDSYKKRFDNGTVEEFREEDFDVFEQTYSEYYVAVYNVQDYEVILK